MEDISAFSDGSFDRPILLPLPTAVNLNRWGKNPVKKP